MSEYEFVGDKNWNFDSKNEMSTWDAYANHRDIVTGFIKSSASSTATSLCVLGAGYCFDLNLKLLRDEFDKITLVDLSEEDIAIGLAYQDLAFASNIESVTGIDVTGVDKLLEEFASNRVEASLNEVFEIVNSSQPQLPELYDCVASTCLLSQLLYKATQSIGEDHERFVELLQATRLAHIRFLIDSLNDGGTGILFSDFVSSESLPELVQTTDLQRTVGEAIATRNFLHGLNPAMVAKVFDQSEIRSKLTGIKVTDPWRWVTGDRVYACFAIIFNKK